MFRFCAILRLEKALHLYGQNEAFRGVFIKSSLINLRFAQMQGCVFVQRSIALVFSNVIRQLTLSRLISLKMRLVI